VVAAVCKKPNGYWRDFENVRREILSFVATREGPPTMPTGQELRTAGRNALRVAIHEYHGGLMQVAQRLGIKPTQKPKGYWKSFMNVVREILDFMRDRNDYHTMPTEEELNEAGRRTLVVAIHNYHGGLRHVTRLLGLSRAG
jgi:hypothetical protein